MNRPEKTYRYFVDGIDATGKSWRVSGYVDVLPGDIFGKAWQVIGAEVLMKLTNGEVTYGYPQMGRCKGPYTIESMTIKLRTDPESFDTGKME